MEHALKIFYYTYMQTAAYQHKWIKWATLGEPTELDLSGIKAAQSIPSLTKALASGQAVDKEIKTEFTVALNTARALYG